MMKIRVIVAALVAVLLFPILSMAGDVVFIGNLSVPTSALNKYDVRSIFLGDRITWEDGNEIVIVVQKNTICHETFLNQYIGKTPAQYSNYWKKRIFTGKGLAPPSKDNDQEIIDFISQTKGAIGYVSSGTGLDKVKIISVK